MKKVKVTLWNQDTRQNEYKDAMLLHWGISYEELRDGICHYTVAFAMLSDGKVIEVYPTNIKFEVDDKLQKLEAAAPEMFEALANAVRFIKCCPELSNEERRPKGLEKWESILQKATE